MHFTTFPPCLLPLPCYNLLLLLYISHPLHTCCPHPSSSHSPAPLFLPTHLTPLSLPLCDIVQHDGSLPCLPLPSPPPPLHCHHHFLPITVSIPVAFCYSVWPPLLLYVSMYFLSTVPLAFPPCHCHLLGCAALLTSLARGNWKTNTSAGQQVVWAGQDGRHFLPIPHPHPTPTTTTFSRQLPQRGQQESSPASSPATRFSRCALRPSFQHTQRQLPYFCFSPPPLPHTIYRFPITPHTPPLYPSPPAATPTLAFSSILCAPSAALCTFPTHSIAYVLLLSVNMDVYLSPSLSRCNKRKSFGLVVG